MSYEQCLQAVSWQYQTAVVPGWGEYHEGRRPLLTSTETRPARNRVEFEARLAKLVETAAQNGVDPRGPCAVRSGTGPPEYEALIPAVDND
jgi:hypothetical protein